MLQSRPDDVPAVYPHLDGDDLGVEGESPVVSISKKTSFLNSEDIPFTSDRADS